MNQHTSRHNIMASCEEGASKAAGLKPAAPGASLAQTPGQSGAPLQARDQSAAILLDTPSPGVSAGESQISQGSLARLHAELLATDSPVSISRDEQKPTPLGTPSGGPSVGASDGAASGMTDSAVPRRLGFDASAAQEGPQGSPEVPEVISLDSPEAGTGSARGSQNPMDLDSPGGPAAAVTREQEGTHGGEGDDDTWQAATGGAGASSGASGELSQEEADLLLARAIQEQECAFMLLQDPSQQGLYSGAHPGIPREFLGLAGDHDAGVELAEGLDGDAEGEEPEEQDGGEGEEAAVAAQAGQGLGDSSLPQGPGARQAQGSVEEGTDGENGGGHGDGTDGAELSDEELARRLQQEEERAMAARLLAMAGVVHAGVAAGGAARRGGSASGRGLRAELRQLGYGYRAGGPRGQGEGESDENEAGEEGDEEFDEEEEEYDDEDGDEYAAYQEGVLDVDNMTYEELTALGEAIGTEAKGLPASVMARLPRTTFLGSDSTETAPEASAKSEEDDGADDLCAICRCEYETGDELLTLQPCQHHYHVDCITEWLGLNKVCPICKTEVHPTSTRKGRGPRP